MEQIMPSVDYNHVISEIKELNLSDQLKLIEDIAGLIRQKTDSQNRSIMELQGKGKKLWNKINDKRYSPAPNRRY